MTTQKENKIKALEYEYSILAQAQTNRLTPKDDIKAREKSMKVIQARLHKLKSKTKVYA